MYETNSSNQYPTYNNIMKQINTLADKYSFLKTDKIGSSCLDRDILSLSLGNLENPVLFAAAFHAQEWLTSSILLKFCENICVSIYENSNICNTDAKRIFQEQGVVFIPCVNPDGVEIALNGIQTSGPYTNLVTEICMCDDTPWNANARGVDINHNFDAGWKTLRALEISHGIIGPSPRRYGGIIPESEPETQALTSFCRKNNIKHVVALHSQGEEIYWKYGKNTPPRSMLMAQILAISSGYSLSSPESIASHGGFKDWFIEEFSKPGFTIEIGKGSNPLPLAQLDNIYNKIEEMLLIAALL